MVALLLAWSLLRIETVAAQPSVLLGPEFQVNTYTPLKRNDSTVASAASGDFVVVWGNALGQDGSGFGGFAIKWATGRSPCQARL
jgi:hypothetical protein